MKRTGLLPILTVASTATIITPMVSCSGGFVNDDEYGHGNEGTTPEPQSIVPNTEYTIDIVNINKRAYMFDTTDFWFFATIKPGYGTEQLDIIEGSAKYSVDGGEYKQASLDMARSTVGFAAGTLPSTIESLKIVIVFDTWSGGGPADATYHFKDYYQIK